ncbi:hypothetical protein SCATT_01340 [Streptantibioticus cattleyicolor NRRL 8057 = DSM 46488]|uniref:Uncharacterized protein n=1 Tax=Streptantibioticus cattleyicolor (strain ATCC 35852 / DSM 46488 / JCM 4925 / NBRC 14057 / NRRL 8057) TaxID=1003195 RepID=G8X1H6_STREN|nr:hypothetical protein SCATT_01340 [Streptantibioticus cattleyicolor NRRL 8057 = DSM 46488]
MIDRELHLPRPWITEPDRHDEAGMLIRVLAIGRGLRSRTAVGLRRADEITSCPGMPGNGSRPGQEPKGSAGTTGP